MGIFKRGNEMKILYGIIYFLFCASVVYWSLWIMLYLTDFILFSYNQIKNHSFKPKYLICFTYTVIYFVALCYLIEVPFAIVYFTINLYLVTNELLPRLKNGTDFLTFSNVEDRIAKTLNMRR